MLNIRKIVPGISRSPKTSGATGMTLIELMIAMTVLAVGMLGSMVMIMVGMRSNTRNKNDTSAVVLDQEILEKFATLKNYPKLGTAVITDCSLNGGNTHLAALTEGVNPVGNGATMYTAATAPTPAQVGDIDWTQPAPAFATAVNPGYAMQFQTCGGDIFEVRWNVMEVNPNPKSRISLLTVSARQISAGGSGNSMLFAVPTTLRTLIEN